MDVVLMDPEESLCVEKHRGKVAYIRPPSPRFKREPVRHWGNVVVVVCMSESWPDVDEFSVPELGATFCPFTMDVPEGEDVFERILSLPGPDEGVYVISAIGLLDRVSVNSLSGTRVEYEWQTRIVQLKGLYLRTVRGGPLVGRLNFIGGSISSNQVTLRGEVCGRAISSSAPGSARVALGRFKVDFEKLQQFFRVGNEEEQRRFLEVAAAGFPVLERPRLIGRGPRVPRSNWKAVLDTRATAWLFAHDKLPPPFVHRRPPPTMEEQIEQLIINSMELKDRIQSLEHEKAVMKEEIQQLKQQADLAASFMDHGNITS